MTEVQHPASENAATNTGRRWLLLVLSIVGIVLLLGIYSPVFALLAYTWITDSDYSHSFLVPCFSAYLLWSNREQLLAAADQSVAGGLAHGALLVTAALIMRLLGMVLQFPWFEGMSLIPLIMGLVTIKWGRPVSRLARPAILYLAFMIPLPLFLGNLLNAILNAIVTLIATFALQTLGVPAISEENVISLTSGQLDVVQGGRGLYLFFALTVGASLIVRRMRIEKIIIAISAIPIGVVANAIGVVAAGVAYEYLDSATADRIFIDVVGWAMLPVGLLLLWVLFAMLNRLFVTDD